MHPFPVSELQILQERYLERQALAVCRSATFLDCLRARGVPPTLTIKTPRGTMMTVNASQISGSRVKFFAHLDLGGDLQRVLTLRGEEFVTLYTHWLLHEYTERYRALSTLGHQRWLVQVVTLVVIRFLMEQKYDRSLAHGQATFADPWACNAMWHLQTLHALPENQARMIHHITRDPAQQATIMEQFWDQLDVRLQGHLVGIPDPLPPLPEGMQLPFAQLAQPFASLPLPESEEGKDE